MITIHFEVVLSLTDTTPMECLGMAQMNTFKLVTSF